MAIVTLNPDEENATAHAVLISGTPGERNIIFISPDPSVARAALTLAARRLEHDVPENIQYSALSYSRLLKAYRVSPETYSTHVLLPGRDLSNRRRHVHLTHGSGPKPDTTFRAPTNVLASITPQWVGQQLREYKLPSDTEIIDYMPRLEIMRRSIGDRSILANLGLDPNRPLVVWAPTYRVIKRGGEMRVSGIPITAAPSSVPIEIHREAKKRGASLLVKPHPLDAENYSGLGLPVFTNELLREAGVTAYELFGAATLVITDYSSIQTEREMLGLPLKIVQHDFQEFLLSDRGLRTSSAKSARNNEQ